MRTPVDLAVRVGSVELPNPVMTASGTAGHADELAAYFDLSELGAVVVKSLSAEPWAGNAAPRVHETDGGMLNSVGLQNPGAEAWLAEELPELLATRARIVASIWGFTVEAYEKVAATLADAPPQVVAVEVNLSCPNVESRRDMFAHSAAATADAMAATATCNRPRWAKLSPNVTDLTEIAGAALGAGAEALTLINTVMGMAIDPESGEPRLGAGGGGLSGPAIKPLALARCHEVVRAVSIPVLGSGGIMNGRDALEFIAVGATAVQVGTASFIRPRAAAQVVEEMARLLAERGIRRIEAWRGCLEPAASPAPAAGRRA